MPLFKIPRLAGRIGLATVLAFLILPLPLRAGPLDTRPLPAGAKVLRASTFNVGANGAGSNLFTPTTVVLTIDYAVQPGKQLLLAVLYDRQYQQAVSGHRPEGAYPLKATISGTGSKSVNLGRGSYFVFFQSDGSANLSYRAWVK
jgi:hypothetical protein